MRFHFVLQILGDTTQLSSPQQTKLCDLQKQARAANLTIFRPGRTPPTNAITLLAGHMSGQELVDRVEQMIEADQHPAIICDHTFFPKDPEGLWAELIGMHQRQVQMLMWPRWLTLHNKKKSPRHMVSWFPTVEVSGGLFAFDIPDGNWEREPNILTIDRSSGIRGWAVPSGFIQVGETLEGAVARESYEEVHIIVDPAELEIVLWACKRDRDPTSFAHEGNYRILLYRNERAKWDAQMHPNPEACSRVEWMPVSEFLALMPPAIAFLNHQEAARKTMEIVEHERSCFRVLRAIGYAIDRNRLPSKQLDEITSNRELLSKYFTPNK